MERGGGLHILGLTEGIEARVLSRIPWHLFEALASRGTTITRLDYGPRGLPRLMLGALTFRPDRQAWLARFHASRRAHDVLTRTLARRTGECDADWNVALQVLGWTLGQPDPYTLYIDQTRLQAERCWPAWMPMAPGERAELLDRDTRMYAGAAHIFTMGGEARESLVGDYEISGDRVTVAGGGLNLETLPPPRLPSLEPNVLFIGRDFERKGGDVLLEAFDRVRTKVPAARLHLVSPERGKGRRHVIDHGVVYDRGKLLELIESARVMCAPSLYEPWGLALAEAMAHSVPCIGSTVQSIPEILDQGRAGTLVPPNDPDALADAIVRHLTDDELTLSLAVSGRRWVESSQRWTDVADRMRPGLKTAADMRHERAS